jgi:hypothetical protein
VERPWEFEEPLCAEVGTDIFFARDPDETPNLAKQENYREARAICQKCPELVKCAQWGIAHEKYGMWGGMTPKERSDLRKKMRIPLESVTYRDY